MGLVERKTEHSYYHNAATEVSTETVGHVTRVITTDGKKTKLVRKMTEGVVTSNSVKISEEHYNKYIAAQKAEYAICKARILKEQTKLREKAIAELIASGLSESTARILVSNK